MRKQETEKIMEILNEKANFCKLVLKEGNYPEIVCAQFQGMCELARKMGFSEDILRVIEKGI